MTPALTRRALIGGAAAAALFPPVAARAAGIRLTREEHRAVVVGTGFGGGVAALRLAEAGVRVTVLERGQRWPTGPNATTFPSPLAPDKRLLWVGSNPEILGYPFLFEPYTGLLETVVGDNVAALVAAGVGGGSLLYQGMTLQPAERVFNHCLPEQLDWRLMDAVHYPRVARMLRIATAPDELVNTPNYLAPRIFARNARRAGYEVEKIPMPIDWNYALAELRGEMRPSYTDGSGAFGVNNGGKHSVDVTYVAAAEATGNATVLTRHDVTDVARLPDGRWQVSVNVLNASGSVLEKKILVTRALVLSAGSANTTRLLMRAEALGTIPDLPDGLGEGWGTNADRIYVWTSLADDFGATQGGPVVYGSKEWGGDPALANTVIQASIPPVGGFDLRSTMMVGFGVSEGRGRFVWDAKAEQAKLTWPKDADRVIYARIHERATRIAGPWAGLTDTNGVLNTTWHPLGGANMGTVCDLEGRVRGSRGLYVLDGALIPGSTAACNPSMTIAAVAERAMDRIVAADVGTAI